MTYTAAELAAIDAVKDDMDLSNWVRDYSKQPAGAPLDAAIATLHHEYPGGIIQWYNENRF